MKKKKKTTKESKIEISTQKGAPSYLKRLKAKYNPDREGQTFIRFTKKRK